jgi:hypothetical protein
MMGKWGQACVIVVIGANNYNNAGLTPSVKGKDGWIKRAVL